MKKNVFYLILLTFFFFFLNKQVIVKDLFIKDKMTKRERDFSCLAFFSFCM